MSLQRGEPWGRQHRSHLGEQICYLFWCAGEGLYQCMEGRSECGQLLLSVDVLLFGAYVP